MELPQVGDKCSDPNCKQLDFLPLVCKCGLKFCSEHFTLHALNCEKVQGQNEAFQKKIDFVFNCSQPGCKETSIIPLVCASCNKHFCIAHRHISGCEEGDPAKVAAEIEKFNAPVRQFNEAKAAVDKQIDESISAAKTKVKSSDTAYKVQLMRIKNKATGLKSIPSVDRAYFNVKYPKTSGDRVSPIFVSKTWTLGRAIDAVAQELKIANNNNQSNSLKLRLFKKSTGEVLSKNLTDKIDTLLTQQTLLDGEDIILEYVKDDCFSLEINK